MMVLDNKFNLGDMVYLKTDSNQMKRMITQIIVCLDGGILYLLCCGESNYTAYEKEITKQKDYANI